MKKIALLLIVILFAACKRERVGAQKCRNLVCTENFASVTIQFVDEEGLGINVKNYSSVNQRTGDTIKTVSAVMSDVMPGTYFVVDDGFTKTLSEAGDDIKVSGTHPVTNQTRTAIVKVSGGKCACHVEKISGPDQIQFD